jgi:hypothetical protein
MRTVQCKNSKELARGPKALRLNDPMNANKKRLALAAVSGFHGASGRR